MSAARLRREYDDDPVWLIDIERRSIMHRGEVRMPYADWCRVKAVLEHLGLEAGFVSTKVSRRIWRKGEAGSHE